eukprot:1900392-Alexandrium_andersonii.AAC.1
MDKARPLQFRAEVTTACKNPRASGAMPRRSRPRRSASPPSSTAPQKPRWISSLPSGPARCSPSTPSSRATTVPRRLSPRASSCP